MKRIKDDKNAGEKSWHGNLDEETIKKLKESDEAFGRFYELTHPRYRAVKILQEIHALHVEELEILSSILKIVRGEKH